MKYDMTTYLASIGGVTKLLVIYCSLIISRISSLMMASCAIVGLLVELLV